MASMRLVTRNPPKTLMEASSTAKKPMISAVVPADSAPVTSRAPTMTMPEMALVRATSGVCSAGVTPQTTK